jgi:cyclopropane fatty-acyl-phospholipid synthase-like methyltransferase
VDAEDPKGTPESLKARIREYFTATNESSYLAHWSGEALSFHLGLSDETTPSYDEAATNLNRHLADKLGVQKGERLLDAGCGVGGTSIWMARERGARVVGVTIEPTQIPLARKFASERGVADLTEFVEADYLATGLPPGSFDGAFHIESLCQAADPAAAMAHVFDLLKPGGRWGCIDYFPRDFESPLVRQAAEGWVMLHWQSIDETVVSLQRVGFEAIEVEDLGPQVLRSAQRLRSAASNGLMTFRLERALDGKKDPVVEGHVRAAIATGEGLESGALGYYYVGGRRPR